MMRNNRRTGSAILYLLVAFIAVIAGVSLAVDYGRVQLAKTELLQAADAAARAGAGSIPSGTTAAKNAASATAALNHVANQALVLDPNADIEFGTWAPPDDGFEETDDWTAMDWTTVGDEDMTGDTPCVFTP